MVKPARPKAQMTLARFMVYCEKRANMLSSANLTLEKNHCQ